MRPVLARVVTEYQAAMGNGDLFLVDFAMMNEALAIRDENDRRAREKD